MSAPRSYLHMHLTQAEIDWLDREYERIHPKGKPRFQFWVTFDSYTGYVQWVELGADMDAMEYMDLLHARDKIQLVLENIPEEMANKLRQIVEPFDERFRKATRPMSKMVTLWADSKDHWFMCRIPIDLGDNFEWYLDKEGLLD